VDLASLEGRRNHRFWRTLKNLFLHLRLHYQLLLAPIFLWGFFLSGAYPNRDFWLGFLAFHIFLYGGITAFNSYYDRDEGPIGGVSKPPIVTRSLLPFSLGVASAGAIVAAFVNLPFLIIYIAMAVLGVAYSHPNIRLKKHALVGLMTVGLGQGILASLGGWTAGRLDLTSLNTLDWVSVLAVTLVTVGFYPITQIYQIEEDRSRGDHTFAVQFGVRRTFLFSLVVQAIATLVLVGLIYDFMSSLAASLVAVFYVGLLIYTGYWGRTFNPADVMRNFRRVMAINTITSTGFTIMIGLYLFEII
jgi:4-hydroxybenzoate polyprenyltransferase